jgi:hypothetical protein
MRVKYKEDPKAWRKSTLFTVVGLLLLSGLLRWRQVLTGGAWAGAVAVLLLLGWRSGLRPSLFRRYYRFSTWAGFWSSQWVARAILVLIFGVIIVPAGIIFASARQRSVAPQTRGRCDKLLEARQARRFARSIVLAPYRIYWATTR